MATPMNNLASRTAIDHWVGHVLRGESCKEIPVLLRQEIPPLASLMGSRGGCAVQCQHCIFRKEEGPKPFYTEIEPNVLSDILSQLSGPGKLVHEGRQWLPSQVSLLAAVTRVGHSVSVINNGQYATPSMLALCEEEGLAIDTLDVSVDGTRQVHNLQRSSDIAWGIAMNGIKHARRILRPEGKLTSLFTLTSLNYAHVQETGELVTTMVDEWHVTTMSLRPGIEHVRAGAGELAVALEQLFSGRFASPVFLRCYSLDDFVALLGIIGKDTARKALKNAMVMYNAIVLDVGMPLYFYPMSMWANETLVIDADLWWRMPYSVAYTLTELQAGVDAKGNNLSHFNIAPIESRMDVPLLYQIAADKWWSAIGTKCLPRERLALEAFL